MAIWKRIEKYNKDLRHDKEYAKEIEAKMKETEKGDIFSMMISGLLVLWLPCAVVLLLLLGLAFIVLG